MLRSDQILATVEMIQKENLDVRTVTMGINLLDCRGASVDQTCKAIEERILDKAGNFVETCDFVSRKLGIPIVNKRISLHQFPSSVQVLTEMDSLSSPWHLIEPQHLSGLISWEAFRHRWRRA